MIIETIQFLLIHGGIAAGSVGLLICLVFCIALAIRRIKESPCASDQEIKYIEYGPEKGRYYKVAYDPSKHCYYLMTLEIKDSETEGREYKDTYFQSREIIPFWRYKMLGGADKKNREKPVK